MQIISFKPAHACVGFPYSAGICVEFPVFSWCLYDVFFPVFFWYLCSVSVFSSSACCLWGFLVHLVIVWCFHDLQVSVWNFFHVLSVSQNQNTFFFYVEFKYSRVSPVVCVSIHVFSCVSVKVSSSPGVCVVFSGFLSQSTQNKTY